MHYHTQKHRSTAGLVEGTIMMENILDSNPRSTKIKLHWKTGWVALMHIAVDRACREMLQIINETKTLAAIQLQTHFNQSFITQL